jgi:hypothetical protein
MVYGYSRGCRSVRPAKRQPRLLKDSGQVKALDKIMRVQQLKRGPDSGPDNQMSFRTGNHHDRYW